MGIYRDFKIKVGRTYSRSDLMMKLCKAKNPDYVMLKVKDFISQGVISVVSRSIFCENMDFYMINREFTL